MGALSQENGKTLSVSILKKVLAPDFDDYHLYIYISQLIANFFEVI